MAKRIIGLFQRRKAPESRVSRREPSHTRPHRRPLIFDTRRATTPNNIEGRGALRQSAFDPTAGGSNRGHPTRIKRQAGSHMINPAATLSQQHLAHRKLTAHNCNHQPTIPNSKTSARGVHVCCGTQNFNLNQLCLQNKTIDPNETRDQNKTIG